MKLVKTISAIVVLGAFAAGIQAAEPIKLASLADVNGKVLVNKGKGYVSTKSGTTLDSGDRVIALDGSKATVVFSDGCVTQLKENNLLTLDKEAGCGKKPVATGANQPLRYAQAIGSTTTDAGGGGVGAGGSAVGPAAGATGGTLLTNGLIIAGVVGAGALIKHDLDKDGTPISGQ